MRDAGAKGLLAKQLTGMGSQVPEFMNMTTGQIKSRKPKKEKTIEEEVMATMKKMQKKLFVSNPICIHFSWQHTVQ